MMATDNDNICFEWTRSEELGDPAESQMEASRGTLQRESSVSFGRFESDSLSWEKWSSFSQNRYLEEVERFSTPGSVIQKKAYFEAHFKKIAAQKALEQQAQLESQSGINSNYNEDHHLEESEESPDQNGEENDDEDMFSHSIDFDNSPHKMDRKEGNLIIIDPKSGLSVVQTEEPNQYVSPAMNSFEKEHGYEEVISASKNMVLENDEECCILDRDTEVDAFNTMEVDKAILCKEELEERHSPESAHSEDKGIKEAEENEVSSNYALSESQKQERKEKPTLKNTATSNGKRAKVPRSGTSLSTKTSSTGTPRTSKVRVSSGPNNSARVPPKASAKPDHGVAIRKEADRDTTKMRKSVSLTTSIYPGADKSASTRQVLRDKRQASKADLNRSTVAIISKTEMQDSTIGAPKTAGLRTLHKEHTRHQNDNPTAQKKQAEKKQAELKKRGDAARSTSAGCRKSLNASTLDNKASGVVFSFKSDERAEKRKEFYMKLEEKMNAKEAEMNQIQAKTQEEMEAEIKQLRKKLNFKATPMPTFYQEATPTKVENKKIPQTSAKSQKIARKSTNSGTDSDSSSVPTHKVVAMQGVNNNTSPSKKHREAQLDSSVICSVSKAQKETGSRNISPGKPLKSKLPGNSSPKTETIHHSKAENSSGKPSLDELKSTAIENLSANEESSQKSAPIIHDKTSVCISQSLLYVRQEGFMDGAFDVSSEEHNVAEAKSEMNNDKGEPKIIAHTEVKDIVQNTHIAKDTDNGKEKLVTQKAEGAKDKDHNMTSGSVSRIKLKSPRHASPGTSHESKDKAIKAAKHDRHKIVLPVEKGKRESTPNASIKRGMKANAGLACLIADVAVA